MSQRLPRPLIVAVGVALVMIGLLLAGGGAAARAQGLPPRPPVATPAPAEQPASDGEDRSRRPAEPGRITGTVIDTRTGAPAPGIAVRVGERVVQSDSDGNYDLSGLPPGSYVVALELAAGQGEPAEAPGAVDLAAGATLVQHLAFRSPPPAGLDEAEPAPPPPPDAAALPASLPATSGRGGAPLALLVVGGALIVAGLGLRRP